LLPEVEQEAAKLLKLLRREGEALEAREKERRKRRRTKQVEARVETAESERKTKERRLTILQPNPRASRAARTNGHLANEERDQGPYDSAWKIRSPAGDPASSLRQVPVDVVPVEFEKESPRKRAADRRNSTRISEADRKDELMLSECLPEDIADILK
jgi:hypothetical protein